MLPDEGVVILQLVGEDDGLAVFLQRLHVIPAERVYRHGEKAEFQQNFSTEKLKRATLILLRQSNLSPALGG
jgi:hypothetical protein